MPGKIDYDRGVLKRVHPKGVEVYMYRDSPGVYLNAHGQEVAESMARTAGFPIDKYTLARRKNEMMAKAMQTIEAELHGDHGGGERTVVCARKGFNLVRLGLGRHIIEDPDGNNLTPQPLTKEEGEILFNEMAPEITPDTPEVVELAVADDDGMPAPEPKKTKKKN